MTPRLKIVTVCPSAINASTTAGPRKSVPPNTRIFFGLRAKVVDVPASERPRDDAVDIRINRLRFIADTIQNWTSQKSNRSTSFKHSVFAFETRSLLANASLARTSLLTSSLYLQLSVFSFQRFRRFSFSAQHLNASTTQLLFPFPAFSFQRFSFFLTSS